MKWKQTNAHPYSDNVITWENLEQAFKGLIKLYGFAHVRVTGFTNGGDPVVEVYTDYVQNTNNRQIRKNDSTNFR